MSVPRRFLVPSEALDGATAELLGEELHHALRVLRVREGEPVELIDGAGRARSGVVADASGGRVVVRLGEDVPPRERSRSVVLAAALLDSDAWDLLLRDAVALGVARIVPLATARVRPALATGATRRIDRWNRIARESVKQCGRARVPEIVAPLALDEWLAVPRSGGIIVLAPGGAVVPPVSDEPEVELAVGPEGGWTEGELDAFAVAGALRWSLGDRILRAETAAVVALARIAG